MSSAISFTRKLLYWHRHTNKREMPWKGDKNPYHIWLSEIILQQTRVEQGLPYYDRFVKVYPSIFDLAAASDQAVYKLWEGLGYYSRCGNLLQTARMIVQQNNGIFPTTYTELLRLKGIGPYTAAAIASFAYNQPYAVVDGNVFRVLARYFGVTIATDSTEGKKYFAELAQKVLAKRSAAQYNQAIMDFGATVCKPLNPSCNQCPLQHSCNAFQHNRVFQLPVKEKVLKKRTRLFTYFVFDYKGKIYIHQRTAKDIWQSLFEFFLLETDKTINWTSTTALEWLQEQQRITNATIISISPVLKQQLTHQLIKAQFIRVQLKTLPSFLKDKEWQPTREMDTWAFPKLLREYLA